MAEGLTLELILVACFTLGLGVLITRNFLPIQITLFVSLVKTSIPLIYFAWFYDGTWTFKDDWQYLSVGSELSRLGYTPISVLLEVYVLFLYARGKHILYYWWNLLAVYLFGEHYYAPVFLNILLTFISGYYLFHTALLSGFSKRYAQFLSMFFLLHWDVLAWSSFTNLKDILVLTLTIIALYSILLLSKRFRKRHLLAFVVPLFLLAFLRFYVTVFILISALIYTFVYSLRYGYKSLFLLTIIGTLFSVYIIGLPSILASPIINELIPSPYGIIRMLLTPQPWSIERAYSFLLIPSILHWIMFFPSLFGGLKLRRLSKETNLLLIYFIIAILFYGSYQELQGVRHRVQVAPIIAWMQFHFLWMAVKGSFRVTVPTKAEMKRTTL